MSAAGHVRVTSSSYIHAGGVSRVHRRSLDEMSPWSSVIGLLVGLAVPTALSSVAAHIQTDYYGSISQTDWEFYIDSQRNPPFDQDSDFFWRANR